MAHFSSYIAVRYLQSKGGNLFFSWISSLTILGISIGVAAMILVLSVISGFEHELRERFLAANAHVMAYRFPGGVKHYNKWKRSIKKHYSKDIKGVSPFVHADTMCSYGSVKHNILIKGIVPLQRIKVQAIEHVIKPSIAIDMLQQEINIFNKSKVLPKVPAIIVGRGLLSILEAKVGDVMDIISPNVTDSSSELISSIKRFRIIGVYDSGLQHYDNKLGIVSLPAAQSLFHMGSLVTGLEIGLHDPESSKKIARKMARRYDLSVKEWQSYNHNIFEAMKSEKAVIGLIVALVAFVASFNILTTLFVAVSLKRREIALLKALGASNRSILLIFLKQGISMGVVGSLLGATVAFLLSIFLQNYPIISLPDIYLLSSLPIIIEGYLYGVIIFSAVLIAALAGIYPAWSATLVSPTSGLNKPI